MGTQEPQRETGSEIETHKTFCRICFALCGLDVQTKGGKIHSVLPDKTHPYGWRDFCTKGGSAGLVRDHAKRLRAPLKRVDGTYVEVSYDTAINEIATKLNEIRARFGAEAIGTFLGNPALSSSPNSTFFGGLIAGIGTPNNFNIGSIDHNSFLLVGEKMYGSELAVLIPDVDHAKCMLLLGMNPAVSGMHWVDTVADGWKRILAAKSKGADVIIVDPRETPSTRKASTHVAVRPGEDWAFLLGVIKTIFANDWINHEDCAQANGIDTLQALTRDVSLDWLADRCGVRGEQIVDVARRFALAETAVCVARTGVAQNRNGTLGEWLSHALNLITGRTDRKGGRYYNRGVLKNPMKLSNELSPPVTRRSRIGGHPFVGGGYPLGVLPDEIMTPGDGQIRALILNSGNPVVSGPDGSRLDKALGELELLVAVDLFQRESHRHAHWLIPGNHFLEREELFVLFSGFYEKPFAQQARAVVPPANGVMPEWQFFRDLAMAMDVPFMGDRRFNHLIKWSNRLAKITGNPRHAFNPRWVWRHMLAKHGTVGWKELTRNPQGVMYRDGVTYGEFRPSLQTADGRINAAPEEFVAALKMRLSQPAETVDDPYPLRLVNQRRLFMMNSQLRETARYNGDFGDFVEINSHDAETRGIVEGSVVKVVSRACGVKGKARLSSEVPRGVISMDHGWGSRLFDPQGGEAPEQHGVNRNLLVAGDDLDELSGTVSLNGAKVNVFAVSAAPSHASEEESGSRRPALADER